MNRLLIVYGPTGVGKTRLALQLAKEFDGELISADSRQVYKYMDVVTGKDVPLSFVIRNSSFAIRHSTIPYFTDGQTNIWGYDLVRPDEEWSVKHFLEFAQTIISDIQKREKLPIVVGGTGLYLKALTEPLPLISFPRNLSLRKKLEKKSAVELYAMLLEKNRVRALSMNESDRKNPRRLIRALEIAEYGKIRSFHAKGSDLWRRRPYPFSTLRIGLTINNRQELYDRIDRRVDQRITSQLWEELESLKRKGFLRAAPSVTIGYRQLIPYLTQKISKDEAIQHWKFAEHDYARRQLVWFKKQLGIHWFDVTKEQYERRVVTLIRRWYDALNAGKQRTTYH